MSLERERLDTRYREAGFCRARSPNAPLNTTVVHPDRSGNGPYGWRLTNENSIF